MNLDISESVKKDIDTIFRNYANDLEHETQLRESISLLVKNIEKSAYTIFTILEKIHQIEGLQVSNKACFNV